MIKKHQILIFISSLIVIGCSGEDSSTPKGKSGNELIFKQQVQAIGKAKGVEALLQNAADQQRKAIEEQTNNTR